MLISRRRRIATGGGAPVADHLTITTQPVGGATPTVGTQPVAAAKKADGSTDTTYVGTVVPTLNVLTGSATLGGSEASGKALSSGVATFTNLTVTSAAGATWTITFALAGLASATSNTGTTTGGGGQFSDNFATNTIDPLKWDTTNTGSGGASAATGALVLTTSAADGTSKVIMHTACSLDAAGVNGVRFKWTTTSVTGVLYQVHLVDGSGNGWGFQRTASGAEGAVAANVYTTSFGITLADGDVLRFSKSGTNILLDRSTDNGATFPTNLWTTPANAVVTTAMKLRFQVDNTGSGQPGSSTFDDVVWS